MQPCENARFTDADHAAAAIEPAANEPPYEPARTNACERAADRSVDATHPGLVGAAGLAANDAPRAKLDATHYLAFVRRIATRMARSLPRHLSLDDLISSGTLGLLDAMGRFDPSQATRFESFAEFRIRGAILDELRSYDLMARNARIASKRIERRTQELTARLRRPPTEDEIAEALSVSVDAYRKAAQQLGHVRVVSLEDLAPAARGEVDRIGALAANGAHPDDVIGRRETALGVRTAVEKLPPRHRRVLDMYYQRDMTLKQIGVEIGVTESRVCQIMGEANVRLRAVLKPD